MCKIGQDPLQSKRKQVAEECECRDPICITEKIDKKTFIGTCHF